MTSIDQSWLEQVVFVGIPGADGPHSYRVIGTAFWVLLPIPQRPSQVLLYLVTARHIVENGISDQLSIRVNRRTPGSSWILIPSRHWFTHHETDVAVCRFTIEGAPIEDFAIQGIPFARLVGPNCRYHGPFDGARAMGHDGKAGVAVHIGDEIIMVTLLVERSGQPHNLPVARFGRVSRLPDEPIPMETDEGGHNFKTTGYLSEALSIGGVSGAPAYVCFPTYHVITKAKHKDARLLQASEYALLGLVSGHFDRRTVVRGSPPSAISTERLYVGQNTGISVITPAHHITELLNRPDVVSERDAAKSRT